MVEKGVAQAYSTAREAAAERMQDTAASAYERLQSNVAAVQSFVGGFKSIAGVGGGEGSSAAGASAPSPGAAPSESALSAEGAAARPTAKAFKAGALLASLPGLPRALPRLRGAPAPTAADPEGERGHLAPLLPPQPAEQPQRHGQPAGKGASKFSFSSVGSMASRAARAAVPQTSPMTRAADERAGGPTAGDVALTKHSSR